MFFLCFQEMKSLMNASLPYYSQCFCFTHRKRIITDVFFLFLLLVKGLGCHENIFRPFPALSKYAMPFFWLRPNQKLKHLQLFSFHPMDAVHRTRINWYLQIVATCKSCSVHKTRINFHSACYFMTRVLPLSFYRHLHTELWLGRIQELRPSWRCYSHCGHILCTLHQFQNVWKLIEMINFLTRIPSFFISFTQNFMNFVSQFDVKLYYARTPWKSKFVEKCVHIILKYNIEVQECLQLLGVR